ncbi:MAG: single-stranded DNA-binding protein [Chloroflexi bacterium]|nr:single-stranded DNA-binding protein [Chloroflexota bacterium]
MFARLTLAGCIEGEPELHYLPNGAPVVNFVVLMLADSGRVRVHCGLIGKKAEGLAETLAPAQVVIVEGALLADENGDPRTWTDKDSKLHTYFNVRAASVDVVSGDVAVPGQAVLTE